MFEEKVMPEETISQKKISVIIPVYNNAKEIVRCLDSVLAQDYENLEVICINDGSTDESLTFLHMYAAKDRRVMVFSQANQGASVARNKGLEAATGEYISFVDADDYIDQGLYRYFADNLQEDVEIFMFNGIANGAYFFTEKNFYHEFQENEVINYKEFYGLFYGNSSVCNKIFKRDFLKRNDLKFLPKNSFEDVDFWFRSLIAAQKVQVSLKAWYYYMFDNDHSTTKSFNENALSIFETFASMEAAAQKAQVLEYFDYALFQFQYEKLIELLGLVSPQIQEVLFYQARSFLQKNVCA